MTDWMEPPPERWVDRRTLRWFNEAEQLKKSPGKWARICKETSGSAASRLRRHRAFQPPEHWELTSRKVRPNTQVVDLFARYVGPSENEHPDEHPEADPPTLRAV